MTLAEAGSALDRRSTNSDASDGLAGRVTDSKLVEELKGMHCVLLELGYVTDEGVVLVKGRSACAIEGTHEVLAVEVLVRGALDGLTVAESAALLSCLLADRSSGRPSSSATPSGSMALAAEARGLTAPLDSAIRSVLRTAEELALLCDSCGVPLVAPRQPAVDAATAAAEAARSLVGPELAAATLAWAGAFTPTAVRARLVRGFARPCVAQSCSVNIGSCPYPIPSYIWISGLALLRNVLLETTSLKAP